MRTFFITDRSFVSGPLLLYCIISGCANMKGRGLHVAGAGGLQPSERTTARKLPTSSPRTKTILFLFGSCSRFPRWVSGETRQLRQALRTTRLCGMPIRKEMPHLGGKWLLRFRDSHWDLGAPHDEESLVLHTSICSPEQAYKGCPGAGKAGRPCANREVRSLSGFLDEPGTDPVGFQKRRVASCCRRSHKIRS